MYLDLPENCAINTKGLISPLNAQENVNKISAISPRQAIPLDTYRFLMKFVQKDQESVIQM